MQSRISFLQYTKIKYKLIDQSEYDNHRDQEANGAVVQEMEAKKGSTLEQEIKAKPQQ